MSRCENITTYIVVNLQLVQFKEIFKGQSEKLYRKFINFETRRATKIPILTKVVGSIYLLKCFFFALRYKSISKYIIYFIFLSNRIFFPKLEIIMRGVETNS